MRLLLIAVLALLAFGSAQAAGQLSLLREPNPFLEQYQLTAPDGLPYILIAPSKVRGTPLDATSADAQIDIEELPLAYSGAYSPPGGVCNDDLNHPIPPSELCPNGGRYVAPGLYILRSPNLIDRAKATLHEWLHSASIPFLFKGVNCSVTPFKCSGGIFLAEEGLVEALTISMFPAYWFELTGKDLSPVARRRLWRYPGYGEAIDWWRVAAYETQTPRTSVKARRFLLDALRTSYDERVALIDASSVSR